MCTSSDKFIFCTCIDESTSKIDSKTLEEYSWTLNRFIKSEWNGMKGQIMPPCNDLGNEITLENILSALNSNNGVFDFNYRPRELDCLSLRINSTLQNSYFSLIFRDGLWVEGRHNPFFTVVTQLTDGKIKKISEKEFLKLKTHLNKKEYLFEDIESGTWEDFKYKKKKSLWGKFLSLFGFLARI